MFRRKKFSKKMPVCIVGRFHILVGVKKAFSRGLTSYIFSFVWFFEKRTIFKQEQYKRTNCQGVACSIII